MYLSYYSLQKEPFHITPDPEFLFLNESHKEALGSLIYGIEKRKGFIAITGGIGLGKTTIVRSYLETKDDGHIKVIYVFNANITFKELLKTILNELNLENRGDDLFEMMNRLYHALIKEYEEGNNVVIIIDEAQNMPVETLENLRMLSNLETSNDKLIQIVFVGQQEFDELLNRQELRQLKQRIAIRTSIEPLNRRESHEYIDHRLKQAGLREGPIFTIPALERIVAEAKGVPRSINILCDNALITGFGYEQKPVGLKTVNEVISDFKGRKLKLIKWPYLAGAGLFVVLGAVFFFSSHGSNLFKWISDDVSKPEVVRIPIKPEASGIQSPERPTEATRPEGGIQQDTTKPNTKGGTESGLTSVNRSDQQHEATLTTERPRYKKRRHVSPRSDQPSAIATTSDHSSEAFKFSANKPEEAKAPGAPVDISKDINSRLLEIIKQEGPSVNHGLEDKLPPKANE